VPLQTENAEPVTAPAPQPGEIKTAGVVDVAEPAPKSKWYRWRRDGKAIIDYLLDSEVHTFAFSVAANAILSFIPFTVLLFTLARTVFHSEMMVTVIGQAIAYFFPSNQAFVAASLAHVAVLSSRHGIQVFSLVMILVACTGIFLPLEVALNQAWGVTKSRNYLMNQFVAFGLAFLMVVLGLTSILVNSVAREALDLLFFHHTDNFFFTGICFALLATTTGIGVVVFLFSIYWLLPNRRISPRLILRPALITGIVWVIAKYIFVAVLPHLDLESLYGPFYVSVGLLFWAYISGLILFAGAQFSVSRMAARRDKTRTTTPAP
jgi:membrane protein